MNTYEDQRMKTKNANRSSAQKVYPPLGVPSSRQRVIDPQVNLDFIKEPGHRKVIRGNLDRMRHAHSHGQTVPCVMMAGMLLECLIDYTFEMTPWSDLTAAAQQVRTARRKQEPALWKHFKPTDPSRWTLAQRIAIAGPDGLKILTKETEKMADLLRYYRNYVHPEQERKKPLRPWDSDTAKSLVRHVTEAVRAYFKNRSAPSTTASCTSSPK